MAQVSRKKDSLYREQIQHKPGQIVVVFREDKRLEPLIGFVLKAINDNGSLWYRVKLLENPKPQKFPANQVLPNVGWAISPDDKRHFHLVRITRSPHGVPSVAVEEVSQEGTQVADK